MQDLTALVVAQPPLQNLNTVVQPLNSCILESYVEVEKRDGGNCLGPPRRMVLQGAAVGRSRGPPGGQDLEVS